MQAVRVANTDAITKFRITEIATKLRVRARSRLNLPLDNMAGITNADVAVAAVTRTLEIRTQVAADLTSRLVLVGGASGSTNTQPSN